MNTESYMNTMRREIRPHVRVLDSRRGIVEYTASDESLDSYKEVIRASGWRFTHFKKNAPFVDSHDYMTIEKCVGRVIDAKVVRKELVETVQWAIDVESNTLARKGFEMTAKGYLKAVSVGFWPVKAVSKWDKDPREYYGMLVDLGYSEEDGPRVIYVEQEQVELSACIIGANPNALARAYKEGILSDADFDFISRERVRRDGNGSESGELIRMEFLDRLERVVRGL